MMGYKTRVAMKKALTSARALNGNGYREIIFKWEGLSYWQYFQCQAGTSPSTVVRYSVRRKCCGVIAA
jgi:hypothetical protein